MSILQTITGLISTPPDKLTLRSYSLTHYVADGSPPRARTTLKWLRNAIDAFDRHLGRPARLADLTDERLLEFAHSRRKQASESTTARDVERLLTIWRHAHDRGFIRFGPRRSKPQIMGQTQKARAEL